MDNRNVIEEIFEVFQNLLVKLNLEDDIIGYTLCQVKYIFGSFPKKSFLKTK